MEMDSLQTEIDLATNQQIAQQSMNSRQDEILRNLFDGKYGSTEENCLENLVDQLENKRKIIRSAEFRWSQALILCQCSLQQLKHSVEHWTFLGSIENIDDK